MGGDRPYAQQFHLLISDATLMSDWLQLHQAEKGAHLISWFWLFVCLSKIDFKLTCERLNTRSI